MKNHEYKGKSHTKFGLLISCLENIKFNAWLSAGYKQKTIILFVLTNCQGRMNRCANPYCGIFVPKWCRMI
jgi:hypothetical protein